MADKENNEVTYEQYDFREISADNLAQLDDAMKNGTLFQGATVKSALDRYCGKILEYMDQGRSAKDIAMAFSHILKTPIAVKDIRACAAKAKKLRERRAAAVKRRKEAAHAAEGEAAASPTPKKSAGKKAASSETKSEEKPNTPQNEAKPAEPQAAAPEMPDPPLDGGSTDEQQKEKKSWFN